MLTQISRILYSFFKKIFGERFDETGFIAYTNNIQWFALARIASLIISLVTTIVIARLLGPSAFGMLSYVISVVGLFTIIANLGIGNVVYKELILEKDRREEILGSALLLNLITASIALIILGTSLIFIQETWYVKSLMILMSLSFITQPFTLLAFDFLKDKEGKYVTISQTVTLLISSFFKIVFIFHYNSIAYFIIMLVLENIITGLLYAYQIKKIKHRTLSFTFNKKRMLSIFSLSLPLILYGAFSEIYARIDQIMLKYYIDTAAVGLYSASVRLTEIWYMVPNILAGALFPALANAKDNREEYTRRFKMLLIILTTASIVISVTVYFFRNIIVELIYGKEFLATSPILGIYIFSIIGFFVSVLIYQDLFLNSNKWLIVLIPFLTAALNIGLNIILIPPLGVSGAAIATAVSYNVTPALYVLYKIIRYERKL